MRTLLKILASAAAVIAAVLIGGALILWLFFDPNDYRDDLAAMVEARTGRAFAIEDNLALAFFPWLGVETGRLRLGNAAGFGDEDFASVASAAVRVRLLPLLRGRLEIGTVELDGLELNLARDAEGRESWADLLVSAGGPSAGAPAAGAADPMFGEIDIAGIDVRDGIIFWRENTTEVRYVVSELSLRTGRIAPGLPVDTALGLQLVGVDPAFTARLDGRTTVVGDSAAPGYRAENLQLEFRVEDGRSNERAAGRLETNAVYSSASRTVQLNAVDFQSEWFDPPVGPERVSVGVVSPVVRVDVAARTARVPEAVTTIGDTEAHWDITADRLFEDPRFAGAVTVTTAPVAQALEWLGIEAEAALGDFDLASRFTLEPSAGSVTLTDLEGAVLDMAVSGEVSVNGREVTGRMEAPAFDPGRLFSVLPPETTAALDVSAVERLAVAADFAIDRTNGVFSLREFTAVIPGATVTGAVDRLEGGNRLRGRVAASDVDSEVLLAILPALLPGELGPERIGAVSLDTAFDYGISVSEVRFEDFTARAFGLEVAGGLTVGGLGGAPRFTGTLQVEPFSPRSLLRRFGQPVPATADPDVLSRATLSTEIDAGGNRAEFASVRMRLDDTQVTGRVTMEDFAEPRYAFDLAVDRIDVDRYLASASEERSGSVAADRAFADEILHALRLEGRVTAADLRVSGLSLEDFSTAVFVGNGVGRVESVRTGLYGGEFRGGMELDARAGGPILSLRGAADAIDTELLLTDLSGEPALSGTGTFDLELSGTGRSLNEALATTSGSIVFALRDGAIRGVSLDHTLCDVYNRMQGYPRPAPAVEDSTPYHLLQGTAQVSDGFARTSDLFAGTPTIEVSGGGRMDLISRGIDYDLVAAMIAGIPIAGCEPLDDVIGASIPLIVSGTVTEPRVRPDFEELLMRSIREGIEDTVIDRLQELLNPGP